MEAFPLERNPAAVMWCSVRLKEEDEEEEEEEEVSGLCLTCTKKNNTCLKTHQKYYMHTRAGVTEALSLESRHADHFDVLDASIALVSEPLRG